MVGACAREPAPQPPAIRLWHSFNPQQTEALNRALEKRAGPPIELTVLPFARAQTIVRDVLAKGDDCPDLVRIDATWLPELARAELLIELEPHPADQRDWLQEAVELATDGGVRYGIPQSLDVLALVYRTSVPSTAGVPWPPQTMSDLLAAAHRFTTGGRRGLSVRVDGYWFVPFLRAWGADVIDPTNGTIGIDTPEAAEALRQFAALFAEHGVAPPPAAPGEEQREELRLFHAGDVAITVNGPWAAAELAGDDLESIAAAPFPSKGTQPSAPRGGHVFVVPQCARRRSEATQLALELTEPALQSRWARRFGTIPTTQSALDEASELSRDFYRAVKQSRPLPRHPISAELFDDLTPAVAAVVGGNASAEEALAGVARAWRRLAARHNIALADPTPTGDDGGK